MLCGCPRNALCERCRDGVFAQLRGTAACRGEYWADRVARHVGVHDARAWPSHAGRAADIARRLAADLADDPQLLELLAAELARWAAKRWQQLSGVRYSHARDQGEG